MAGKFRFHSSQTTFPHKHYVDPGSTGSTKPPSKQKLGSNRSTIQRSIRLIDDSLKKLRSLEKRFSKSSSLYATRAQVNRLAVCKNNVLQAKALLQDISVRPVKKTIKKFEKLHDRLSSLFQKTSSPISGSVVKVRKTNALPIIVSTIKRLEKSKNILEKKVSSISKQIEKGSRKHRVQEVLEEEEQPVILLSEKPQEFFDDFFKTAKNRGWKVDQGLKKTLCTTKNKVVRDVDEGMQVIQDASLPKSNLLTKENPIGLLKFPIILVQRRRLTESAIKEILKLDLGYEIHIVLGGYLVVTGAILMGLHRSIVRIYDNDSLDNPREFWNGAKKHTVLFEKKAKRQKKRQKIGDLKIKIDTGKFEKLVPFLQNENPEYEHILSQARPTNPALLFGSHYYSPLFPQTVGSLNIVSIENWSPLFEEQQNQTL